jgi:hypothetical protein
LGIQAQPAREGKGVDAPKLSSGELSGKSVARKQFIRGFVQVLIGAVRVRQMSDQLTGKLVNVDASSRSNPVSA